MVIVVVMMCRRGHDGVVNAIMVMVTSSMGRDGWVVVVTSSMGRDGWVVVVTSSMGRDGWVVVVVT